MRGTTMMFNIIAPSTYDEYYLEKTKCRPFFDNHHKFLIQNIIDKKDYNWNFLDDSYSEVKFEGTLPVFKKFKSLFTQHITSSTLNNIVGLDSAIRLDIIQGCTQYIDNLHLKGEIQVLEKEYSYHHRLGKFIVGCTPNTIRPKVPLIISAPFSSIGKQRSDMNQILDTCAELSTPVHIDAAWLTAARNVNIDFSHPAIESFGVSMSKGYGTSGWNRIGLRWTKNNSEDSITLMNDNLQITAYPVVIANYILENTQADHLWNLHGANHIKICNDFGLTPSDTIHMTTKDNQVIGISPLLRYLECTK
jgi:hypothetical protein